jgi:hypothetical protein
MNQHKPIYLYVLKCFWDHQRHYYVLLNDKDGWHWKNINDATYFSRNHRTQEEVMSMAKDQGTIKKVSLMKLFPQGI